MNAPYWSSRDDREARDNRAGLIHDISAQLAKSGFRVTIHEAGDDGIVPMEVARSWSHERQKKELRDIMTLYAWRFGHSYSAFADGVAPRRGRLGDGWEIVNGRAVFVGSRRGWEI